MSLLYMSTEEWNSFAGSLVDMSSKLRMDRYDNERTIRELVTERDALLVERNELADQCADLESRVAELAKKLEKANADNVELVQRLAKGGDVK